MKRAIAFLILCLGLRLSIALIAKNLNVPNKKTFGGYYDAKITHNNKIKSEVDYKTA